MYSNAVPIAESIDSINTHFQSATSVQEIYKNLWDKYTEKYNSLSDELTENNINPMLLSDVISLRLEIEKIDNTYPIFTQ